MRAALLLPLLVACTVDGLDYTGKACPCPEGYVCQQPANVCASAGDSLPSATDWTSAIDALYLFEQGTPDLGIDASGNARNLTEAGTLGSSDAEPQQGAAALDVIDGSLSYQGASDVFNPAAAPGVTFGGWFYVTNSDTTGPLRRAISRTAQDSNEGYQLGWDPTDQKVECVASNGTTHAFGKGETGSWPTQTWIHAACRWDAASGIMTVFVGSYDRSDLDDPVIPITDDGVLTLSSAVAGVGVTGQMDEVFFHGAPLDDASIRRMWACGVDGSKCRCDGDNSSDYADCGSVGADCNSLAPCDTSAPQLMP